MLHDEYCLCEHKNDIAHRLLTYDVHHACGSMSREGLCGWGNFEKQTYTRDNHQIADGVLMITVSAPADMRHPQQQQHRHLLCI